MSDENSGNTETEGGKGPGAEHVGLWGIVVLLIYVILCTGGIFYGIKEYLPECASLNSLNNAPSGNSNNNVNANASNNNSSANSRTPNRNSAGNANSAATNSNGTNAAANGNANSGGNNANAGGNTNSSTLGNSNTGGGDTAQNTALKIASVSPVGGVTGGNTSVLIRGKGFMANTAVYFDGLPATVESVAASGDSMFVKTPHHPAAGRVDIIVKNPSGDSDILSPGFNYACSQLSEPNLLLIVIFAGALGGALHALRSLYWYVGNRDLRWSWTPMYLLLPFSGAAMATVFYLIFHGGFISNTPTTGSGYWFIIGIAVIVGMFSQQAALKLRDIANVTLTKPGEGSDRQPQRSVPITTSPEPTPKIDIHPNVGSGGTVTIKGQGYKKITKVTVDKKEVTDLKQVDGTSDYTFTVPSAATDDKEVEISIYYDGKPNPLTLKYTYQ